MGHLDNTIFARQPSSEGLWFHIHLFQYPHTRGAWAFLIVHSSYTISCTPHPPTKTHTSKRIAYLTAVVSVTRDVAGVYATMFTLHIDRINAFFFKILYWCNIDLPTFVNMKLMRVQLDYYAILSEGLYFQRLMCIGPSSPSR